MVDDGDLVVMRGPFGQGGRVLVETWRLRDDEWKRRRSRCTLSAVSPPSLNTASWRIKGVRPEPGSKNLEILVQEWACASGHPPAGRIVPPDQTFRPGALYLVVQTFPITRTWEANERDRKPILDSKGRYAAVDCPGAPPAPYKVKLDRRLGNRTLYDGGVFPPKEIKGKMP